MTTTNPKNPMNVRYFIQIDGEDSPRGPLPAGAVRRLIENGDIAGHMPMCQEGDENWLTVEDYWDEVMPPKPAPAQSYAAYAAVGAVHPALVREPLPIWKVVFGVLCFILAFSAFYVALVWNVFAAIMGVVWMVAGLKLTKRK